MRPGANNAPVRMAPAKQGLGADQAPSRTHLGLEVRTTPGWRIAAAVGYRVRGDVLPSEAQVGRTAATHRPRLWRHRAQSAIASKSSTFRTMGRRNCKPTLRQ